MRPAQSLMQLALCLSTYGSVASAAGWPRWLPELDALVVRADSTETQSTTTQDSTQSKATDTPSSTTPPPKSKGGFNGNTAKPTTTGKGAVTGTMKRNSTHTQFAPDSPPGGMSMQTPNTFQQATGLYMISDYVTWSWNYTSLLGTPTAIDVLVSCSSASATWTLTGNMSFETSVNYVWDTKKQANDVQNPLGVQLYTLIVKDSDASITQAAEPGYLGAYANYQFAMYTGEAYVPYRDWTCPGSCSIATPAFDRKAVGLAAVMSVVTFLSFTWFVAGLGLH